jgi:hypothetical protein
MIVRFHREIESVLSEGDCEDRFTGRSGDQEVLTFGETHRGATILVRITPESSKFTEHPPDAGRVTLA